MRENIGLFKAKDINTKEWRKGYYWTNEVGNHFIRVVKDKEGNFINPIDYEIDPETLCECTGLANLYTHDFIRFDNGAEYEIIFEDYMFKISNETHKEALFESEFDDIEIIGNKFSEVE